jgi:hypothetical protein
MHACWNKKIQIERTQRMVKTMTKGERSKKSCENGTNKKKLFTIFDGWGVCGCNQPLLQPWNPQQTTLT